MIINPLRGSVALFVDDANPQLIEYWKKRGATGVTTNPSIVAKAFADSVSSGDDLRRAVNQRLQQIVDLVEGLPVSIQVMSEEPLEIVSQANAYRQLGKNVVVKVPFSTRAGYDLLLVINELASKGIPINVTCLMNLDQMILAAMNGARYVSLFVGRVWESGADPIPMLTSMRQLIDENQLDCQIIAGSIRQTDQVTKCWCVGHGAHIVTVPAAILAKFGQHPGTVAAAQEMLQPAQTDKKKKK